MDLNLNADSSIFPVFHVAQCSRHQHLIIQSICASSRKVQCIHYTLYIIYIYTLLQQQQKQLCGLTLQVPAQNEALRGLIDKQCGPAEDHEPTTAGQGPPSFDDLIIRAWTTCWICEQTALRLVADSVLSSPGTVRSFKELHERILDRPLRPWGLGHEAELSEQKLPGAFHLWFVLPSSTFCAGEAVLKLGGHKKYYIYIYKYWYCLYWGSCSQSAGSRSVGRRSHAPAGPAKAATVVSDGSHIATTVIFDHFRERKLASDPNSRKWTDISY